MACKWSVSFFKIMIPWQWTTKVLLIVSTFSIYSSANDTGLLTVDVKAPWKRIDFVSNFIESIAGFNASLYIPTLEAIFGLGDSDVSEGRTDKEIYDYTMKQLSLEPSAIDFVNFNLVYKKYSPRVASHYFHYETTLQQFGDRLKTECTKDSFGNQVETKNGLVPAWVLYNDKIYCSVNDLFALQTDKSNQETFLFDRVIGDSDDAPLLTFYGDPTVDQTREFLKVLYEEAQNGKLRFVWRYIPSVSKRVDSLPGFAVEVPTKNIEYYAHSKLDLNKDFDTIKSSRAISKIGNNVNELGIKLTSFILSNKIKLSKFELLQTILNNMPIFYSYLNKLPQSINYKKVQSKVVGNEQVGLSKESFGIYINGSPIHPLELDVYKLYDKISDELSTVKNLVELGFNSVQAKLLLAKFGLLSAVKQAQFRTGNTLMGNNENRFKVFQHAFNRNDATKGGVVFINDIESDRNYGEYSTDRQEAYLGVESRKLKPNQIPPLKENVHDLIFALNLASKKQLKAFFTFSKIILDSGIPQQVGVLPIIGEDPLDEQLAIRLYHITKLSDQKEALALLYKYMESTGPDEIQELLKKVDVPTNFRVDFDTVLNKFSIDQPSVVVNGVIHDLFSSNWQVAMSKQIEQDNSLIKTQLRQGDVNGNLKDIIYNNAKSERNLRIHPLDPSEIIYKKIDHDLMRSSIAFKKVDKELNNHATIWLVSDFRDSKMIDQLVTLLNLMKRKSIQVRVFNVGNTKLFSKLAGKMRLTVLTNADINAIISTLKEGGEVSTGLNEDLVHSLEQKHMPVRHSYLLVNSRYFRLDPVILNMEELSQLIEYELTQRLRLINEICVTYVDEFPQALYEYNSMGSGLDDMDWFDLVSSIVTKSFHVDDKTFVNDVNRYDFGSLDMSNSIDYKKHDESKQVDVLVIMDPLEDNSQKLINILDAVKDFSFVNVRALFQPKLEYAREELTERFYQGVFPPSIPYFEGSGKWDDTFLATFDALPVATCSINMDVPKRWVVVAKSAPSDIDLNSFKLDKNPISVSFEITNLLIEGNARDVNTGKAPNDLQLQISNGTHTDNTLVMTALNYFQLKALPGVHSLSVKSNHSLLSASDNKFDPNIVEIETAPMSLFSLDGLVLQIRVSSNRERIVEKSKHADINIFTIAGGHEYEKLVSIMIASVKSHNLKKSIKFWILSNFISPQFKVLIPHLIEKYSVEIELVTYKWPTFLRKQSNRQREIWAYKILFLDELFPQDLDRVIFVDADQVCRTDLTELVNMDLEGAPYAFTPMCESNKETEGFRFWKSGYWAEVLQDDLKYHISALYVVDLSKFKSVEAGNRLRAHYQKLSSDPNSLSNLDQDLPNNMQRQIKIKSLPQEWLWCETWCSSETFNEAKMIDLCNNPLTKENKIDTAKRLIPEWVNYEKEVLALIDQVTDTVEEEVEEDEENFTIDESHGEVDSDDDALYHDEL
ncbi:UDP-glucose:Glycoprotein Glucosyltransferase family protein [Candida parapsilosis]|uniref:UDP-glucose:Glycoprotein Glucosyltransferase family protein n=1 Tax=Candida parapsilosis TaxID=5480 RepID=A0A8X7TCV7_CANPA|nr:UDP-glucose:Glycoprotein Glucosyltransferase family protein [Candida parapsilosis]KAF6049746.1 UDP-glucose:Glycoprotein Glucosyltransferase family protein [Candida parapsilosis]KAF6057608.1 UDP-glucose:Glycoprotein Glucosyltransferase family protein [Candida parapsilosis]KAF6065684.1 UDP-glucose:Glycoprotein Glucosyltransferase family protein [Candida parapsilosis]KAI5904585.1 UDP-glucose:glycoprotein glucosyltransferase [Candida parapsilosis]